LIFINYTIKITSDYHSCINFNNIINIFSHCTNNYGRNVFFEHVFTCVHMCYITCVFRTCGHMCSHVFPCGKTHVFFEHVFTCVHMCDHKCDKTHVFFGHVDTCVHMCSHVVKHMCFSDMWTHVLTCVKTHVSCVLNTCVFRTCGHMCSHVFTCAETHVFSFFTCPKNTCVISHVFHMCFYVWFFRKG